MDILTTCYETDMRFPGVGIHRVRWYFTDQDFLPFPTCYGSKNWFKDDVSDLDFDTGEPGEVWTSLHVRRDGTPPLPCECKGPEGSPEAWLGVSDSTSPLFGCHGWGAAYNLGYADSWDSQTFAEE